MRSEVTSLAACAVRAGDAQRADVDVHAAGSVRSDREIAAAVFVKRARPADRAEGRIEMRATFTAAGAVLLAVMLIGRVDITDPPKNSVPVSVPRPVKLIEPPAVPRLVSPVIRERAIAEVVPPP